MTASAAHASAPRHRLADVAPLAVGAVFGAFLVARGHLWAALVLVAIVGGAILPPFMGLMADSVGIQQSFILPALCFLAVVYYGLSGYKIKTATA